MRISEIYGSSDASPNSVFATLGKDGCGWGASQIRGTLGDIAPIGVKIKRIICLGSLI